eukprot:6829886-Ditylum_brightwellii.AAC.1
MLTHFPVPGNTPMAKDELCDIIYCMIKLLDGIKQKSETTVVDDNSDKKKNQAVIAGKMQINTKRLRATNQKVPIILRGL